MSSLTNVNNKNEAIFTDLSMYKPCIAMDGEAIINSIVNALPCNRGDRFFNPDIYIDTDKFVFELDLPQLRNFHILQLEEQIYKVDSRVKEVNLVVSDTDNPHSVYVDMNITTITGDSLAKLLFIEKEN